MRYEQGLSLLVFCFTWCVDLILNLVSTWYLVLFLLEKVANFLKLFSNTDIQYASWYVRMVDNMRTYVGAEPKTHHL